MRNRKYNKVMMDTILNKKFIGDERSELREVLTLYADGFELENVLKYLEEREYLSQLERDKLVKSSVPDPKGPDETVKKVVKK